MSEPNKILFGTDFDNIVNDLNPINSNYEKLKQDLSAIRDKSTIHLIDRSNWSLNKLEKNTFDEFYHLIDLNLSHNILTYLPRNIFDQLLNLQTINLSHNLISELEDSVFKNNKQLITIDLSNNLITEINGRAFDDLNLLRKLDFSYNTIEISEKYMNSQSLQELNLSYNQINDLKMISYWVVPNLIDLQLNNNKISVLDETMFQNITNIENLNFSNNFVQKLPKITFHNLHNLKQVDLSNNSLTTLGNCFENKPVLNELNLLNNPIVKFRIRDFNISESIRKLKLTICKPCNLERFINLKLMSDFELHINNKEILILNNYTLSWINGLTIERLYLVIKRGKFNINYEIKNFFNLDFLHIEFLESNSLSTRYNIAFHINRMPKLKHFALININKLKIIRKSEIHQSNLTYLDLTGINNVSANFLQNSFVILEHLNLSYSHIANISRGVMNTLLNLKYLNMNSTRITFVVSNLFQYNINLEVILFKDCQIHTIGKNAFGNSENLKEIDIRGNTQLRITQSLLNEIPNSAVVYYD